jgi:hypothetical protein
MNTSTHSYWRLYKAGVSQYNIAKCVVNMLFAEEVRFRRDIIVNFHNTRVWGKTTRALPLRQVINTDLPSASER